MIDDTRGAGTAAPPARQVRQGDVLLVPAESVPEGARPVARDAGRVVLAYGEVTGHAHVIGAPGAALLADGEDRYLRVPAPATLSHEEHAAIEIAPGTYRVVIQREYVPSDGSAATFRRVVD